jgi:hypothetical protein
MNSVERHAPADNRLSAFIQINDARPRMTEIEPARSRPPPSATWRRLGGNALTVRIEAWKRHEGAAASCADRKAPISARHQIGASGIFHEPPRLRMLSPKLRKDRSDMTQTPQGTRFTAAPLTFIVRHELWDGNIQDHADQGVSVAVAANVNGRETALLRFNCFDIEKSYIYGPENPDVRIAAPMMLGGADRTGGGMGQLYRMDPVTDGNPIGWTIRTLEKKLLKMLDRAGYKQIAAATDLAAVRRVLPDVEACARDLFASRRNTVKHNRGTDIFEAGNIRFGLEMRRLPIGDGGLAIHVLGDVGGSRRNSYVEETELLAFDCFWDGAHYHYGPRNKNHRIYWDLTLVEDPLEWVFEQLENRKLAAMLERAGYPGIAADLDLDKVASVVPAMKKRAFEMYTEGERLTGHKGLPLEPTPNLAAD